MDQFDTLLTAQDLSEYLHVPVATLYGWRHRGEGPPSLRVGKHLRYRRGDVEAWIAERVTPEIPAVSVGRSRRSGGRG